MIQIRDGQTGRLMRSLTGHTAAVTSLCFFRDGIRLVSSAWDGTVCIWDTQQGTLLSLAHVPQVSKVQLTEDESQIIAGTVSGDLILISWMRKDFLH